MQDKTSRGNKKSPDSVNSLLFLAAPVERAGRSAFGVTWMLTPFLYQLLMTYCQPAQRRNSLLLEDLQPWRLFTQKNYILLNPEDSFEVVEETFAPSGDIISPLLAASKDCKQCSLIDVQKSKLLALRCFLLALQGDCAAVIIQPCPFCNQC